MGWKLQEQALLTNGLEPTEKLVLIALASFANEDTGECWPSQKTISKICERTEKRVNQLIGLLCDKGLVTQIGRHGPTIKYKVFPSEEDLAKVVAAREGRKRKYHAAAAERGKKIKENNKKKREVKAAGHTMDGISGHTMDGISGHTMDGISGHPMDGIQTNKKHQEENLLSNQDNNNKTRQDSVVEGGLVGTNQPHPQKLEEPKSQASKSVSSKDVDYPLVFENARRLLVKDGKTKEEAQRLVDLATDDFAKLNDTWRKNGWHKENGEEIGNPQVWLERTLYHKANDKAKEGPMQAQAEAPTSLEEIFNILKSEWAATYPEVAEYIARFELADLPPHQESKLRAKEAANWKFVKGSRIGYVRSTLDGTIYEHVQDWRQQENRELENHLATVRRLLAMFRSEPRAYYDPDPTKTVEKKIAELEASEADTKDKLKRFASPQMHG